VVHLEWSEAVGKRVRTGDWQDQAISTLTKIEDELRAAGDAFGPGARHRESAAQLIDYFMEEAKVVYVIYNVWTAGFVAWLEAQGIAKEALDAELRRLRELLAYPDGRPLEEKPRWDAMGVRAGRLANGVRSYDLTVAEATAELEELCHDWRRLHDRYADLMAGLLAFVVRHFGEDALEACYRSILEPYFDERYMPYDIRRQPYEDTLERNLYVALESMRGHLVGPTRRGDIELVEHEDRWEIRFDPCASGGRMLRGDPVEGTGSRMLAPYDFGVIEEPKPWTWNESGVCHYCAHCNLALSMLPAERWGHPLRTVDPPLWRGEDSPETRRKCQWTVWKSLEAIPEHEYERLGRTKPSGSAS
jgi:hypothetical protein